MKKIFIYKLIITISTIISLVSCDNKLDIEPRQSIDAATAIENNTDLESVVKGAYSIIAGGELYGTNLNILPELLANTNNCTWVGTFSGYRQINTKTMNDNNSEANRTWLAAYRAINNSNQVLANLDKASNIINRDLFEGEARLIRGIMLFELVRLYALPYEAGVTNNQLGVPIIVKATTTVEEASAKFPRNTVEEVYTQVITDLNEAASKLPDDNGTRADRFSALAFLSRVYLQQGNFAEARDAANEVIISGKYQLGTSVSSAFANKNTNESIFEIQQNDQNNAGTSNDGLATFYANLPGIGRADLRPSTAFYDQFEDNDTRKTTLFYIGDENASPPVARPNFLASAKWTAFGQNIPVIRLAELYLTRAECNFRLNTSVGDLLLDDYNLIHSRAGASTVLIVTLDDILKEREFELCFEGLRVHDYKRTQRSPATVSGTVLDYNSELLVMPIPIREIQANPLLVQNPGY